jgi:hypothetical protein
MIYVKIHITRDGRTLIAACDKSLLGTVFEEGKKQLDLSGEFYKGEIKPTKEVADLLRNADLMNLVGEHVIELGVQEELFSEDDVARVAGIPMFQSVSQGA